MKAPFLSLLIALGMVAGCESDEECPPCADVSTVDDAGADPVVVNDAEDDEVQPDGCLAGRVDCSPDETDLYGLCVDTATIHLTGGSFTMGTDDEAYTDANPAHEVTVSAFSMQRTEVSNAQYAACVTCGVCDPPQQNGSFSAREPYYGNPEYDDFPVIFVTWTQAAAYCEGLGGRLPTEAEWEFAARGTEGRTYPWGDADPDYAKANYDYIYNDTMSVEDLEDGASPDGILNLAGNVWEWVQDPYQAHYYAQSPSNDPQGPATGAIKVARGGSFGSTADQLATYVRASYLESGAFSNLGFRCAFP